MSQPGRDGVTYPVMVGYVNRSQDGTRRRLRELSAELALTENRIREDLDKHFDSLSQRMTLHETWHRDQMSGEIRDVRTNRPNWLMAVMAVLSLVVAAISIVVPLFAR